MYFFDRSKAFGVKENVDLLTQLPEIFQLELTGTDWLALGGPAVLALDLKIFRVAAFTFFQVRLHP